MILSLGLWTLIGGSLSACVRQVRVAPAADDQLVEMAFVPGGDVVGLDDAHVEPFFISRTEVTRSMWAQVWALAPPASDGNRPIAEVSWCEAVAFCNRLSLQSNLQPVYTLHGHTYLDPAGSCRDVAPALSVDAKSDGFRLPTRSEWIHAATAAGSQVRAYAGSDDADDVAWHDINSPRPIAPQPVATLAPNALGIYDMSGNVAEWVQDSEQVPWRDPPFAYKFILGGHVWTSPAPNGESALSPWSWIVASPHVRVIQLGFRVARTPFGSPHLEQHPSNKEFSE